MLLSSLPLMGIGNPRYGIRNLGDALAHYPSWGSETRNYPVMTAGVTADSLPLMGIGNRNSR